MRFIDQNQMDKPPDHQPVVKKSTESERRLAQLAAVVETSGEALLSVEPDGTIVTWNPAAQLLFGYTENEAVGRNITLISPRRDYSPAGIAGAVFKEGRVIRMRTERRHKSGALVKVSISAAPMRDQSGGIIGASAVIRDISSILRGEERLKLLMRELAHRGKNMLAIVQSIARQSLTEDECAAEARDSFVERIAAMARTYQTLNAEGFEGARLSELVRLELETWSRRMTAEGPDVLLRTNEAQTFGLMLHELAANAVRHGSLSAETGRVAIAWDIDGDATNPRFKFEWREFGGPAIGAPSRRGFGSTLVTDVVEQSFGARPAMDFAPEGLNYRFSTALSNFGRRIELTPLRARIRSHSMRSFYDSWWREDGGLPSLDDIGPMLADNIDHASVVEIDLSIEPASLRIMSRGKDLPGAGKRFDVTLGDKSARDIPGSIEATYRRCARQREPMYEFSILDTGEREPLVLERLFVPCSNDGVHVTNIVGMSTYSAAD